MDTSPADSGRNTGGTWQVEGRSDSGSADTTSPSRLTTYRTAAIGLGIRMTSCSTKIPITWVGTSLTTCAPANMCTCNSSEHSRQDSGSFEWLPDRMASQALDWEPCLHLKTRTPWRKRLRRTCVPPCTSPFNGMSGAKRRLRRRNARTNRCCSISGRCGATGAT